MHRRRTQARPRRSAALALAVSIVLAGCAATTVPPSDRGPRLAAAAEVFGGQFDYVYVPSKGKLADEAFLAMSRVAGPTDVARDLASRMAPAETQAVRLMVTGQSGEKTLRVLLDALSFYRGGRLPHLEVLYLGEPSHQALLAREFDTLGATFRFAPYPN